MQKRLIAIGDIHGCYKELQILMDMIKPRSSDQFFFLGDYIDRGRESAEVVTFLIAFGKEYDCVFLKGNHEQMFYDARNKVNEHSERHFTINGGALTFKSYLTNYGTTYPPQSHLDFYNSLLPICVTEEFIFVHAGLNPSLPIKEQQEGDLLWIRDEFLDAESYPWEQTVVHGHTPCEKVEHKKQRICVDTGCIYGGKLSAIDLTNSKVWSVKKGRFIG